MARTKKGDVVFKKNIHIKSQNQKLDTDKDIKGFPTTLMELYFRIIKRFPFYFSVMFSLKTARQFAGMVSGSLISMWTFGLFENVSNVNFSGSYWSSTAFDEQKASALYYYYNRGEVSVSRFYRDRGLAVRLVKDVK